MYRKEIQTAILQSFVAELGHGIRRLRRALRAYPLRLKQWLSFAKRTPVALVLRYCRGGANFFLIQSISAHNQT